MDKTAQTRGIPNQLREFINIPGKAFEGMFKPELQKIMDELAVIDDKVRAILNGTKIGKAEAPADQTSAKQLIKSARSKFNRREYVAGITDLGLFHRKMWEAAKALEDLKVNVDAIHHKFLFEGLDESDYGSKFEEFRKHMDELNKKKTASLEEESQELVKEAGIIDTLINIGTKRGWSLAAWERKYPKRFKSLRDKGNRLINDAEKVLEHTISCLKKMATARAIRRPDSYVEESGKIRGLFTKFDAEFQSYYNTEVKEILELKAQYDAKKPEEKAPEAPVAQPPAAPPAAKEEEKAPDTQRKPQVPPTTPAGVPAMPGGTEGPPKPKTEEEKKSSAHQNFYESLQAMSQESPLILAKYIAKYAASIQTTDPETAVNLFGIAKQIKG